MAPSSPVSPVSEVLRAHRERERRRHRLVVWVMAVGIAAGGLAFAWKVASFLHTMSSPDAEGFADVPVTAWFFVAGGWLSLLVWCLLTGRLREMETSKLDLLAKEERYDRLGI